MTSRYTAQRITRKKSPPPILAHPFEPINVDLGVWRYGPFTLFWQRGIRRWLARSAVAFPDYVPNLPVVKLAAKLDEMEAATCQP